MKVLHVIATPREFLSNTLQVSEALVGGLRESFPGVTVDTVDLYHQDLPAVAGSNIEAKYSLMVGQPIDKSHAESWHQIENLIKHFMAADVYVISVPMWNFSIPYALKYYIDCLVQPGYVFKYNEQGQPVPLVHGKRMVCVTSRGSDYSENGPLHSFDFQEPYLRLIFGFIGITDIYFINAQPMDMAVGLRQAAIETSIGRVKDLLSDIQWTSP